MYETSVCVSMTQVGQDGLMRPHDLLAIMQDCSFRWLSTEPVLSDWMQASRVMMVIASRQMDIVRMPCLGEELTVRTSLYKARGYLGYRETSVLDAKGEVVAQSWGLGAWVASDGHAVRVPEKVMTTLVIDPESDMVKLPRHIGLDGVVEDFAETYRVRRSDIDINGHMNNTGYVRIAWDRLVDGFQPVHLRVEYKNQARLDDDIILKRHVGSDTRAFVMESPVGEPYCVVEFSRD